MKPGYVHGTFIMPMSDSKEAAHTEHMCRPMLTHTSAAKITICLLFTHCVCPGWTMHWWTLVTQTYRETPYEMTRMVLILNAQMLSAQQAAVLADWATSTCSKLA